MPLPATREDVRRLVDEGAQAVDVLPPAEYAHAHLKGAINIPLKSLTTEAAAVLDRGRPVVVYCMDTQ
ncbi:MAG: rhodanese-like domain-containing protein [Egibacteraceae bacterium]